MDSSRQQKWRRDSSGRLVRRPSSITDSNRNRSRSRSRSRSRNRNRNTNNRDDDIEVIDLRRVPSSENAEQSPVLQRRSARILAQNNQNNNNNNNRNHENEIQIEAEIDLTGSSPEAVALPIPDLIIPPPLPLIHHNANNRNRNQPLADNVHRMDIRHIMQIFNFEESDFNEEDISEDEAGSDIEIMAMDGPNLARNNVIFIDGDEFNAMEGFPRDILDIGAFLRHFQRYAMSEEDRQQLIRSLPTRTLNASEVITKSCRICLSSFVVDDQIRTLPCFHQFHVHCVDTWFESKLTCPTCRHSIQDTEDT
eukprot:48553_1